MVERGSGSLGLNDRGEGVDRADSVHHIVELFCGDEVRLVEQNPVSEGDLMLSLVDIPVWFLLVQVYVYMLRVDEANHRVDSVVVLNGSIAIKSEANRTWVC